MPAILVLPYLKPMEHSPSLLFQKHKMPIFFATLLGVAALLSALHAPLNHGKYLKLFSSIFTG